MLFDMTDGELSQVARTTFAAEHVLERIHLQAALRDNISVLGDDLLVVAEEFGDFEEARRRIDLLCVDRTGRLVVVEIKRTEDGGHMELQALRYAAMVSTMTLDQLEVTLDRHLSVTGHAEDGDAAEILGQWLDSEDGEPPIISRDVRIILVSADFGREITTTVLWLNEMFGTDIRCVRLSPYLVQGRLLLDVQQVIPLPEAEQLTTQLRRREQVVKAATSGADWTPYIIKTPAGDTPPLRKRRAILALVLALHEAGVPADTIRETIRGPRFLAVEGELTGEDLEERFVETYPKAQGNLRRWFLDEPIHEDGRTWVLSKMWGTDTEPTLRLLVEKAPSAEFSFYPA